MQHRAVAVGEHLHLDVARPLRCSARRTRDRRRSSRPRLRRGQLERLAQLVGVAGDPHPLAAAAGAGLDQHRVAGPLGRGDSRVGARRRRRRSRGGSARPPRSPGAWRSSLSPIARIAPGGGPIQVTLGRGHGLGECRVLRQEAEPGMDRLRSGAHAPPSTIWSISQVGADRRLAGQLDRLVGGAHRRAASVERVVDGDAARSRARAACG